LKFRMSNTLLESARLRLIPHTPAHWRALLEGPEPYASSIGFPPADGLWNAGNASEVSSAWMERLKTATVADPWMDGFAVLHQERRTIIGMSGFKGPPGPDGAVEIAYGIAPGFQGKGYATEAAQALVTYAFDANVRLVRAHTLPQVNA